MQYYMRYLKKMRKLSDSSISHYIRALRKISKMLIERNKIEETIYEIRNINELQIIKEYIYKDPEFVALDRRGNRMYSAGLNNYLRFATGEDMFGKKEEMLFLDMEVPVGRQIVVQTKMWSRSAIIKRQTIEVAEHMCEIDQAHSSFVAKATGKQYMEGHHVIPMCVQDRFDKSIDVYANVICLCPICHRLLHYGLESEKKILLNQIYESRIERFISSGIKLSKEEFIDMVM